MFTSHLGTVACLGVSSSIHKRSGLLRERLWFSNEEKGDKTLAIIHRWNSVPRVQRCTGPRRSNENSPAVATDLLKLFFRLVVTSVVLPITDRKRLLVNFPRIIWFTEWSGSFIMFSVIGDCAALWKWILLSPKITTGDKSFLAKKSSIGMVIILSSDNRLHLVIKNFSQLRDHFEKLPP